MSDAPSESPTPAGTVLSPRKFGIMDVFAATTLIALLVAPAAHFLRGFDGKQLGTVATLLGFQLALTTGMTVWTSYRRQQLLLESGNALGVGYRSNYEWKHWPALKCALILLSLAALQLAAGIAIALFEIDLAFDANFLFLGFQLGGATAWVATRWLWRTYPGAVEFYEKGIMTRLERLIPWEQVELRHSTVYPGRIVAVLKAPHMDTLVIQVAPSLAKKLCEIDRLPRTS